MQWDVSVAHKVFVVGLQVPESAEIICWPDTSSCDCKTLPVNIRMICLADSVSRDDRYDIENQAMVWGVPVEYFSDLADLETILAEERGGAGMRGSSQKLSIRLSEGMRLLIACVKAPAMQHVLRGILKRGEVEFYEIWDIPLIGKAAKAPDQVRLDNIQCVVILDSLKSQYREQVRRVCSRKGITEIHLATSKEAIASAVEEIARQRRGQHDQPAGDAPAETGTASASAGLQAQDEGEGDGRREFAEGEREAMITSQSALPQVLKVPLGERIYVVGLNPITSVEEVNKMQQFCRLSSPEANKLFDNWPSDLAVLVIMGTVQADMVNNLGSMAAQRSKMCIAIPGWKVSNLRQWLEACQIRWGSEQPLDLGAGGAVDQVIFPAPEQKFVWEAGMSARRFVDANYCLANDIGGEGWEAQVLTVVGKHYGVTPPNVSQAMVTYRKSRGIKVLPGRRRGLPEGAEARILTLLFPSAPSEPAPPPLPAESGTDPLFEPSPAASADELDDPQLRTAFKAFTARLIEMTLAVMNQKIAKLEQEKAAVAKELDRLRQENEELRVRFDAAQKALAGE